MTYRPWKLPLIVAVIVIPIAGGFVLAGPALGLVIGTMIPAAMVIIAVRMTPKTPINPAAATDRRRRVLVVVTQAVNDGPTVELIAEAIGRGDDAPAQTIVLSPAESGFLSRWASDPEPAREEAQGRLVVTIASLAKAHITAEARVGDAGIIQATEDLLQTMPATEVILITGTPEVDTAGDRAAGELEARLSTGFTRITNPVATPKLAR